MRPELTALRAGPRNLRARAWALSVLLAASIALAAVPAEPPGQARATPSPGAAAPAILGGLRIGIEQVPWQVYVEGGPFAEGGGLIATGCGGSILDASHILTAAHCVDEPGSTQPRPAASYKVLAGDSSTNTLASSTAQVRRVARIRRDPLYSTAPTGDDVAILTLQAPLVLSRAAHAQAIPLVASGATPAPGTSLTVSGYGKQQGAAAAPPDGGLFSATLTAIGSDACRNQVGPNSAVLLCALAAGSATCQGDSGGPVTEGAPPVQVGIVDFGGLECPAGRPDVFTNLAAPEVRAFIEGSEAPPRAARMSSPPVLRGLGARPVDFAPLRCRPGAWSGAPRFTYTFQTEGRAPRVLQRARADTFVPGASLLGVPLLCIVQAANGGGTSTARSAVTAPLAPDTSPPRARLAALRCHLQACTLTVLATDPNGAALTVRMRARYAVATRCAERARAGGAGAGRAALCVRTTTVPLAGGPPRDGAFAATASRLPYGERVTFTAVVTNAAGLRAAGELTRATTLHPPVRARPGAVPGR